MGAFCPGVAPMPAQTFPKLLTLLDNLPVSRGAIDDLFTRIRTTDLDSTGYATCRAEDSTHLLFFLGDGIYGAGRYREGRFEPAPVRAFFESVVTNPAAELSLLDTNPLLFKCLLVLTQQVPSAAGTSDLINVDSLVSRIKASGQEGVLALQRDDDWNLFYISQGAVQEAFFAKPESVSKEASPEEQLLEYAYTGSPDHPVTVRAYHQTTVSESPDADLPWQDSPLAVSEYFLRPRPALVYSVGGQTAERIILEKRKSTLGRDAENDLVVKDASASRIHAIIEETGRGFFLKDQESRNGTLVNGNRTQGPTRLSDGDEIQIGDFKILFMMRAQERTAANQVPTLEQLEMTMARPSGTSTITPSRAAASATVQPIKLQFMTGEQRGVLFPLSAKTIIGRTKSDINTNDPKASRRHAAIERRVDGYYFVDLNSTNGSFINDTATTEKHLEIGDLIKIGDTVLKVVSGGASE